jgi:hypothetical protein
MLYKKTAMYSLVKTIYCFKKKKEEKMKTILSINLLILILIISCGEKDRETQITESQKHEMRKNASEFMGQLKSVLINQMKSEGTLSAVAVCSDTAQILTNNFGLKKGVYIKRVSFKNRNKNNVPDKFEETVLKQFEQLEGESKLNSDTEHFEIVNENNHQYLRYMKPIKVGAPCLKCHGNEEKISTDVKELISEKYPDDKAVGYRIGDIRGAVSVKKLIE